MKRRACFGRINRIPFAFIVGTLLALIAAARPALADRPGTPWKEKAYACFHYRTPAICAQFSNTATEDVTFDVETTINGTPVAAWDVLKLNRDMRIDCDDDASQSGTISCAQIHTNLWTSSPDEFPTGTGANHKTTEPVCDASGDCSADFNGRGPHIPPLGFDIYPVEPGSRWCFRFKARRVSDRVVSKEWSNWACATVQQPPQPSSSASAAPLPPPKPVRPLGKHATWEYGRSVTLDAFSPLGFSVRHRNFLGELTKIDRGNQVDREDATFILRPALNGNADAVSFESVNYPGFFLRHQDFRLKLIKNDNSPLFKDDASFFKRAALAGGATTASFEASKFPGFYIRHRDFHLWLEKNDPPSDLFNKDATFIIGQGLAAAASPTPATTSSQTAKVIADVDVYAKPGGNGDPIGILRAGESVTLLSACADNWCNVSGEAVPGGKGWVYDGPDYDSLQY
jgi:hypothetical protein